MTPTHAQLAKIHIAKKELHLTEDIYRDILALYFKAGSAKELTDRQAAQLLGIFRAKGWRPKPGIFILPPREKRLDGEYISIKPGPAAARQRKVLAMWHALGYSMDKLQTRCLRQFGVERFEQLTDSHALHVLITDLERRTKARKAET